MQAEIIRNDGDLKREVWRFELTLTCKGYDCQEAFTFRHFAGCRAPLPPDVVQEAKDTFKAEIDKLEVTR